MDPLYPAGLDENRAIDDLYTASWICSENGKCIVQNFSAAVGPTSAVYKIYNFALNW